MSAYLPVNWLHAWFVLGWLPLTLAVGFGLARADGVVWRRGLAWGWVGLSFGSVHWLCLAEPAGFRMLAICGVVLFAMKGVIGVEAQLNDGLRLNLRQWLAWGAAWPGMKPALFAETDEAARDEAGALFRRGVIRLLLGLALLGLGRGAFELTHSYVLATLFLLPGVSLVLHFGLFNLLSGAWRFFGVKAYVLFPAPLMSTSLSEFWGKRWNLPFTEMTQRAVYWPLSKPLGRNVAAVTGFCFSGLLHELAISVPVQAGYGLPSLYFVIHGGLVMLERTWLGKQAWFTEKVWVGRTWTLVCLALPMPILFHPAFLKGVVWPIVGIA